MFGVEEKVSEESTVDRNALRKTDGRTQIESFKDKKE
jgi:hypothetical protein